MKRSKCIECRFTYNDEKIAKRCQDWCRGHKSCNLKIIKQAITKMKKGEIK